MLSREEEKQNVIKWLEHPHELGCEQRCKITKSPGVFMEGESLKIEW